MAMWMEFTPKDWLMMRVGLIFRDGDPDPEDASVRAYLHQHQLEPRHQVKEERDGVSCDALYFGQCYLGHHVHVIQELYQKGLERSFLLEKLCDLRRDTDVTPRAWLTTVGDADFERVLPALAEVLHGQVTFTTNAAGYLDVTLDPALVQRELSHLMVDAPAQTARDRSA
jgi:hypothetical protein